MLTALDLSDTESWEAIALRIESFAMSCEQNHSSSLAADIKLGSLLEAGCKLFQKEKILGRINGTFDDWMTKTAKISPRHARKLRAVARVFTPFPQLCKLPLPTTEVYNRLSQIRKVLEVPEYQSYWQQVVQTRKKLCLVSVNQETVTLKIFKTDVLLRNRGHFMTAVVKRLNLLGNRGHFMTAVVKRV